MEETITVYTCSECDVRYTMFHAALAERDRRGNPIRQSNEWTESERLAHWVSHITSSRARRLLTMFHKLSTADQQEVCSHIVKHSEEMDSSANNKSEADVEIAKAAEKAHSDNDSK